VNFRPVVTATEQSLLSELGTRGDPLLFVPPGGAVTSLNWTDSSKFSSVRNENYQLNKENQENRFRDCRTGCDCCR